MRICVDGNIGSGKSGCLRALERALPGVPCLPEPLEEWGPDLDLFYANQPKWALHMSLRVLQSFAELGRLPTCIVERGPLACRYVFGQVLRNRGVMSCQAWDQLKEYHDALGWEPDVMFFVKTPADVCMDRVRRRGRECERDIDAEYLHDLDYQYGNMLRFLKVPVVEFDGTLAPAELHAAVVAKARELLGTEVSGGTRGPP